jgi:hypothetical protein
MSQGYAAPAKQRYAVASHDKPGPARGVKAGTKGDQHWRF